MTGAGQRGGAQGHHGSVLWPFSASVVCQDWAHRVVSPAYEGLGVEERRSLLLAQPDSYMHATRSPEDVGYALSPAELAVLNQMALIRLLRLGAFESRPDPAVYVYRLIGYGCRQRGIVGVVPLEAYRRGRIRPHERTHADREELLSEFLALTSAQSSPVGLTFRGTSRISAMLDAVEGGQEPLLDFIDPNDVAQRVWEVTDPTFLRILNEDLEGQNLYVTDGHHRLGAGLVVSERVRRQRKASSAAGGYLPSDIVLTTLGHEPPGMPRALAGDVTGEEQEFPPTGESGPVAGDLLASDAILAALFPHDELRLLVFHRRGGPAGAPRAGPAGFPPAGDAGCRHRRCRHRGGVARAGFTRAHRGTRRRPSPAGSLRGVPRAALVPFHPRRRRAGNRRRLAAGECAGPRVRDR